jgi:predicted membrane protein
MGDFGYVVLIIFIIIRILIAAGLFYLIVIEIRRYRRRSETRSKEANENAGGKDADDSNGSRS